MHLTLALNLLITKFLCGSPEVRRDDREYGEVHLQPLSRHRLCYCKGHWATVSQCHQQEVKHADRIYLKKKKTVIYLYIGITNI